MKTPIRIYNRHDKKIGHETIYGRRWMELCYDNPLGRWITALVLARRPISKLYGWMQQQPRTRHQIAAFIRQYDIDMTQVETPPEGFASFNDFFIRRLKPEARPIDPDPQRLVAPADSRLQVVDFKENAAVNVKGMDLCLSRLLGSTQHTTPWEGGQVLVFRLAPCDYHRFGHVVDGIQGAVHSVNGRFHSVNPLATRHKPDVLMTNYRQWCLVQSPQWGTLLYLEVGAMMVGSIVQCRPGGGPCYKGQEKGYFQFGGSTVVVVMGPDSITIDADILDHSRRGIETLVRYGEGVGTHTQ